MKTLVIEHTAPFQGLPELVADAEGLFAKEGLKIEFANTNEGVDRSARTDVLNPQGLDPFRSHGRLLEQGKADMYNACEWGNYCRVQNTGVRSRQLGRRAIVTYAAIAVQRDSARLHAAAARSPQGRRAVLSRHALSRAAYARRFLDARPDCRVQRAARFTLPLRPADEGRDRRHDADRALVTLAEKKGCGLHVLGVLQWHAGGYRQDRCRNDERLQPRRLRGGPPHQRE